jgi:hypothetical protein
MWNDAEGAYTSLRQLRDLGIRIALDDFGTGYSSLSNLRRLAFDKIKIDRSFVSDLSAANVNAIALVRSMAQLGASLGLATTAEGVETKDQLDRLRAEGCTEIQGFLLSEPRPVQEIERLFLSKLRGREISNNPVAAWQRSARLLRRPRRQPLPVPTERKTYPARGRTTCARRGAPRRILENDTPSSAPLRHTTWHSAARPSISIMSSKGSGNSATASCNLRRAPASVRSRTEQGIAV